MKAAPQETYAASSCNKITQSPLMPGVAPHLYRPGAAWLSPGLLFNIISWLPPFAALAIIWRYLIFRKTGPLEGGGLLPIGQSHARVYTEKDMKVTFADVAGVDEAKQELAEVLGVLKNPGFAAWAPQCQRASCSQDHPERARP